MFLFKSKKLVVDCFTRFPAVAAEYPIKRSSKFTPEWWKALDTHYEIPSPIGFGKKTRTMKHCPGFIDLYRHSWTVPLWSDVTIHTKEDGNYAYFNPNNIDFINNHAPEQTNNALSDFIHLKFDSFWALREKTGVKFLYYGADWSFLHTHPSIKILQGIIDFKTQTNINVNILFPKSDGKYEFFAGKPLSMLTPLTDKQVFFKTHVVNDAEFEQINRTNPLFKNKF